MEAKDASAAAIPESWPGNVELTAAGNGAEMDCSCDKLGSGDGEDVSDRDPSRLTVTLCVRLGERVDGGVSRIDGNALALSVSDGVRPSECWARVPLGLSLLLGRAVREEDMVLDGLRPFVGDIVSERVR